MTHNRFVAGILLLVACPPARAKELTLDAVQTEITARQAKWVAAESPFSRLSVGQRNMLLGLSLGPVEAPALPTPTEAALAVLPKSWDWRDHDAVSGVRNQKTCGSCWAFAMTQALESYAKITQKISADVSLSEQVLLSCSGVGDCEKGGTLDANFLQNVGLPPESDYPYTAKDGDCAKASSGWKERAYKIGSWYSVEQDLTAIKAALVDHGPMPTSFVVHEDFVYYKSGVYSYVKGRGLGGHAVLLVGYNDDGQYFIVKNSWGAGWGEGGYFRIAYSEMATAVDFARENIAYLATKPSHGARYAAAPGTTEPKRAQKEAAEASKEAAEAPKEADADQRSRDIQELDKSGKDMQKKIESDGAPKQ